MKKIYEIIGTQRLSDEILLKIKPHNAVKKKDTMSEIMSNPLSFVEKMKNDAIRHSKNEQLLISEKFWSQHKFKIGDLIEVEVGSI